MNKDYDYDYNKDYEPDYLEGHETPGSLFKEQDEEFAKGCFGIIVGVALLLVIGAVVGIYLYV